MNVVRTAVGFLLLANLATAIGSAQPASGLLPALDAANGPAAPAVPTLGDDVVEAPSIPSVSDLPLNQSLAVGGQVGEGGAEVLVSFQNLDENQALSQESAPAAGASAAAAGVAVVAGAGTALGLVHLLRLLFGAGSATALFSRTQGNDVLKSKSRSQILDLIRQNPGVCLSDLQALMAVGWGTIVYHVERLASAGLIVSLHHGHFRRFYENGSRVPPEGRVAAAELENQTSKRLAVAIARHPGTIQRDLCEQVGIRAPVAHKHLARLEQARLLTRRRTDGRVQYFPTEQLDALVLSRPNIARESIPVDA